MPFCPRSSVRSERHRAKVEVAGAIPAVDAILPLCLSSYRASFVNSYSSVQVRPGAPSGLWCNNSISPCEGDGPGANPGFLTSHSLSGLSCRLSFNRMPPHESDHALLDGLGYSELCTVALKTGSCISDLGECCSGQLTVWESLRNGPLDTRITPSTGGANITTFLDITLVSLCWCRLRPLSSPGKGSNPRSWSSPVFIFT